MFCRQPDIKIHMLEQNSIESYELPSNKAWSAMFHPIYGYCHTFKPKSAVKNSPTFDVLSQIDIFLNRKMFAILHGDKDLPDDSDGDLSFIMTDWKNLNLERKSISQSNLKRFPCKTGDKYLTCMSEFLHRSIKENYGCKLSFLDLGHFMQIDVSKLPECSKIPNFSEVNEVFSSNHSTT